MLPVFANAKGRHETLCRTSPILKNVFAQYLCRECKWPISLQPVLNRSPLVVKYWHSRHTCVPSKSLSTQQAANRTSNDFNSDLAVWLDRNEVITKYRRVLVLQNRWKAISRSKVSVLSKRKAAQVHKTPLHHRAHLADGPCLLHLPKQFDFWGVFADAGAR